MVNGRLLVVRDRVLGVQSTPTLGGVVGRHHKQRPLTTRLWGWSRSSYLLLAGVVAVSLPLAFLFSTSIALFGLSVLFVGWTVVAGLRFLWSEGARRLPHQVERALVGAAALGILAGVVAVVEDPQTPSTDGDAGGSAPGRQEPEAPESVGALPPGDTSDGDRSDEEARPGSAPYDLLAGPLRLATAADGETTVSIGRVGPDSSPSTAPVEGSATAASPASGSPTSTPTAGGLPADEAVPGSSGTAATTSPGAAATSPGAAATTTPSAEQPVHQKPAADKPAAKPAAEKPAADKPADQPAADKPAAEKPAADKPAEQPVPQKPAAEKPAADKPADQPAADKPAADKPAADKPAAKPADQPAADKPAAKPADQPAADKRAAEKPADQPAADKPAAKPAADKPAETEGRN